MFTGENLISSNMNFIMQSLRFASTHLRTKTSHTKKVQEIDFAPTMKLMYIYGACWTNAEAFLHEQFSKIPIVQAWKTHLNRKKNGNFSVLHWIINHFITISKERASDKRGGNSMNAATVGWKNLGKILRKRIRKIWFSFPFSGSRFLALHSSDNSHKF